MMNIYLIRTFIKAFILVAAFLVCPNIGYSQQKHVEAIVWGGGGAFTSVQKYNGDLYLSSDVSGVWKQIEGSWQPYVTNLTDYNVTSLVVFNELLFAITTTDLLHTNGNGDWVKAPIKLNTYRGVTDQAYALLNKGMNLCIAGRKSVITCLNKKLEKTEYEAPEKIINGVFYNKLEQGLLYYYSAKKLYSLDLATGKSELVHSFKNKIVQILETKGSLLLATSKRIFQFSNFDSSLYALKKSKIINVFPSAIKPANALNNDVLTTNIFINIGSKWHSRLRKLSFEDGNFQKITKVSVTLDKTLPHRAQQKSLTKLLSINKVEDTTYLTDYWGVYALNESAQPAVQEISNKAYNVVASDLIIANNHLYVSTMDNGVLKIDKHKSENSLRTIQPISFDTVKGHAWSMLHFNNTLFAIFSPWDKANDVVFKYSEIDGSKATEKITKLKQRKSKGAFWGNAYARQLFYYYGVMSFRDGFSGGIAGTKQSAFSNSEYTFGEYNKVYKGINELNGLLYLASCETPSTISVINSKAEEQFLIRLPKGFCTFTSYKHNNTLYFLGARGGKSLVYKLEGRRVVKFAEAELGSAFYAMAANPKNSEQMALATITWSNKATSGMLLTSDGGKSFTDQSCLLSHKNGVVAIKIDEAADKAYILQKVGGVLALPYAKLFSDLSCQV